MVHGWDEWCFKYECTLPESSMVIVQFGDIIGTSNLNFSMTILKGSGPTGYIIIRNKSAILWVGLHVLNGKCQHAFSILLGEV